MRARAQLEHHRRQAQALDRRARGGALGLHLGEGGADEDAESLVGCPDRVGLHGGLTSRRLRGRRFDVAQQHALPQRPRRDRSEEHTSELQSLMRTSYAVFCLKKKTTTYHITPHLL